jgi:hypothetical protein
MSKTGLCLAIAAAIVLCAGSFGTFATQIIRPVLAAEVSNGKRLAELCCAPCRVVTVNQRHANADAPPFEEIVAYWHHRTDRSSRPLTPSVRSSPVWPCTDSGCSTTERPKPPTNTLAPAPTPAVTLPLAPKYSPASPPRCGSRVGAITAHAISPPVVKPISTPIVVITPL